MRRAVVEPCPSVGAGCQDSSAVRAVESSGDRAGRREDSPLVRSEERLTEHAFGSVARSEACGFDPEDQAARFEEQAKAKAAGNEESMYYDADYVRALEYGLPPTAGEGIGIDRLVMLFTDISQALLEQYRKRSANGTTAASNQPGSLRGSNHGSGSVSLTGSRSGEKSGGCCGK